MFFYRSHASAWEGIIVDSLTRLLHNTANIKLVATYERKIIFDKETCL